MAAIPTEDESVIFTHRSPDVRVTDGPVADPIVTEVVRNGLNAAADNMRVALQRAAFSPIIYDARDFACGLYDTDIRLMAQARVLPFFLGTLSTCVTACLEALGGPDVLEEGDVIVTNHPYHIGGHSHDVCVVTPAFYQGELVGYAAIRAHHLDVAGKEFFCTDTQDMWQEGVFYPAVRLYRRGERQDDLWRTMITNTRLPEGFAGDLSAQIGGARLGLEALERVIARYGLPMFRSAVEQVYNYGERRARAAFAKIPDGVYTASHLLDGDGLTEEQVPFSVTVEVSGSDIVIDYTDSPDQTPGPINSPLGSTVSGARCAVMTLAGGTDTANEGFFRPVQIRVREGSLFHPIAPAPTYIYWVPTTAAIEVILHALSDAVDAMPGASGGDVCAILWYGIDEDGNFWGDGTDHSVGTGAGNAGDAGPPMMHFSCSGTRTTSAEVLEARTPLLVEHQRMITDSSGAGRNRGGLGASTRYRALRQTSASIPGDRTKVPTWGVQGGGEGTPNSWTRTLPDGTQDSYSKVTGISLPTGAVLEVCTAGGGGWGDAQLRPADAVHADVAAGYLTSERAREQYPHAFA